ncbi:MAG: PulJ/GspJ family protein [Thermodesulfobium sp.]
MLHYKLRYKDKFQNGLSFLEVLLSVLLGSIIILTLVMNLYNSSKTLTKIQGKDEVISESSFVILRIEQEIRQSGYKNLLLASDKTSDPGIIINQNAIYFNLDLNNIPSESFPDGDGNYEHVGYYVSNGFLMRYVNGNTEPMNAPDVYVSGLVALRGRVDRGNFIEDASGDIVKIAIDIDSPEKTHIEKYIKLRNI